MIEITGNTRICAIVADPIHHVKTPQGLNALLRRAGRDAVMVPFHAAASDLGAVFAAARALRSLAGLVITVPHKTNALALCDTVTDAAALVGAVNVVRRDPDGRLCGHILDGEGFVAGLKGQGLDPAGMSAYLAGAGGAANAIAFSLAQAGVSRLTIANRTRAKVEDLIVRLRGAYPGLTLAVGGDDPSGHDLVVNGTSLGLRPGDGLPCDVTRLTPDQVVAEIIMEPAETPLLAAARKIGCRTQDGAPMLASQLELMAGFLGVL